MGTEGKVKILEQVDGRGISPTPTKGRGLFYSYRRVGKPESNSGRIRIGISISDRSGTVYPKIGFKK